MFRIIGLIGLLVGLSGSTLAQQKIDPKKPKIDTKQKWDLVGFVKEVEKLPHEEQLKTVREKLRELNPGFVDYLSHKIEDGVVVEIVIDTRYATNVA
ncbi:MAG TPA: hypothetical protein VG815_10440, partial [Chloroflexota bacterium]|nr:hypothetical protein [Chloroflexota bacterium]